MMIAAAFLVLLRPYSIQCVLLLLLLLLGTIATILFFCCWHRRLRNGKHPIKSVLSGRPKNRVGLRTHHFRSEGFRHSPHRPRRSIHARVTEEKPNLVEVPESEPDSSSSLRKRKVKKRVLPEFYQSVQVTPTRKPSSSSGNPSLHCSMSSSADFSDEDEYSLKSGSASPAPGDTLPWNLPRHERSKRKIQGGSVLDPAERAVLRIADERDRVQKKTFTKWINQHLVKVRKHINDLYEDLRDGHNLISLLEVLSGDTLPRERDFLKTLRLVSGTDACAVEQHGDTVDDDKGPRERGRMRFHRLQNVQIALDYLKRRQVKLVNIRNDDITDGNPKLTLGLIWTIILHFQISEIHVTGESEDMTAKERLLLWSKQTTEGYVGVRCENFTTSWRDGRLFNALIHKYRPDLVDMSRVSTQTNRSNLEDAFCVAEQLGVARLLDPEDVDVQSPDEKSVITYVSTLYDAFPKVPDGVEGVSPNDVDIKWVEYQNMIKYLSQWIKHNVAIMSSRSFPNNPVELKALYTQYLQFKEHEIPQKENEKTKIKNLYKMLEMWIEFGRLQLPPGHHPNDVEKEWGKLIVAMLEREKSLRPEVERLEMLQQIANRVQRDCVNGEDKLALARTALQSDAKRLESGIQFLNEAEIAGYLLECENILRQQVVDIQILLDGKFPFADQLVQRVSKLRDDLLALRAECSSVYSKGRTLTTEQTKMMISGITQSLNSGFSQSINTNLTPALTPALTPGGIGTPGSTFTSSLTPCLTPSLTPALTPSLQPASVQSYLGSGGDMVTGSLRHLKNMQIRKPLLKSSLADPSLTEEEVNMKFVQDLLNWVEEIQMELERSEWGSDMPSVKMNLDNHKNVHRVIEEFQMSLKEAKISEIQMTMPLKLSFSDKLNKLEKQYERLLSSSRERQSHLESLHDFVSQATQELIWLNEKEEEEVAFDWSDRNINISKKRDYHADLMRELNEKEEAIKSVQDKAERLMLKNHPARLTIEAYKAAMQTQWSWILQLCSCVEQHLKENAIYFEFFSDAKESMDYLKNLQDSIQRKYSCDRTSSLHRLEDLIQESMDEKEQLLQYRSTVAGLVGSAKNIVQLKPRNPENPLRSSIPVKAICDYRQIEITIYKEDECVLASNSHRAKWKVINPAGNEAMVPSVCFTVPPPNKEAVDMASRTEQLYQNVLALWHHSHVNMKSVVSWHYLMADIQAIRNWNVASIKTMLPGEHQQVLSNLQSHFDEFLEDSEESEVFTVADCAQLERDVAACKEYYQELLRSAEREEHEESVYNHYISEIRNFRMHLEAHEEHLIRQIRSPLERDDLEQSLQRITEHERKTAELNKLKEDLDAMKEKCELFLRQAAGSPSVATLSSELTVLIQSMSQMYSMSSIYMDKLKTVSLVVKHSQSAEALVKAYESKLYEEDAMNPDVKSIENVISTLKHWRTEIDERQESFHDMEDELQKARLISDRMFKAHNERDFDLDWHKEKADQLSERWQNIHSQIDSRLRDLDGISKSLKHYRDSYSSLDEWVRDMEAAQLKAQEHKPEDSKALAELLNKQKILVAEIEKKQSSIDECQKYSEQYSSAVKDYELQLMTFRAMVDSQHKSPLKKRRMQSSSDAIQQEFMDLRTRYTALVTLMTQYVKFASETLKRTEDEERSVDEEKRENGDKVNKLLQWMSNVKQTVSNGGDALKDSNANTDASNKPQVSVEEIVTKKEQIAEALRSTQTMLNKHSDKMTEEERKKAQEQLQSLTQAYNELSQQCSDQTPSADEDFKPLDRIGTGMTGLIDQRGLVNHQGPLLTSNLSEPQFHLGCDEAIEENRIYTSTLNHLPVLNDSSKCIQSSHVSSVSLSDIAAAREGSMCEDVIIKIIEASQVSDEVQMSYTGDTMTLEKAFQCGLIPASVYVNILQRKKSHQDMINPGTAESLSFLEPEEEGEACEANKLIFKGLSRESSETSEGNINSVTSGGFSNQEIMVRLLGAQGDLEGQNETEVSNGNFQNAGGGLKVDAAIQCDLMSSSSTLIVLGNQQQFMGLALPHSGEIQTVSASHESDCQSTSSEFTCRLFTNRGKIAAFYIPENSEVIDITTAIQNGWIDSHTAEVLKSIEIPDVLPDVDHLSEKFSSWLTYKKLAVDGWPHDGSEVNLPSPTEAKQLFISYLIMNSYIDPKSEQRVLILDDQLNKMAHAFLEDTLFYPNDDEGLTDLTLFDAKNPFEDADSEMSLHINDESEELIKNTEDVFDRYDFVSQTGGRITFDENTQHTFEPHNFVSSGNGRITFDEKSNKNDKASKHDHAKDLLVSSDIDFNTRGVEVENAFENDTWWTKSDQFEEGISGNTLKKEAGDYAREGLDIPGSLNVSVPHTFCSGESRNISSPSVMIGSESSFKSCHQVPPHYKAKCFDTTSVHIEQPQFLSSEDSVEGGNEWKSAIALLKTQMEEEGILDVTSGNCYNLQEALNKGLVDDKMVLELHDSQSDEKNPILMVETDRFSGLKQALSSRCHTEQSFLRSHCSRSIGEALPLELVRDSDSQDNFYPEENRVYSLSEDQDLGLIHAAENTQQVISRNAAVTVLDLAKEEANNKEGESENRNRELACKAVGSVETMTNKVHLSLPSESGNMPQMISPSYWNQVTAERINHIGKLPLGAEDSESHTLMDSELTGRISGINTDSKSQTQSATFAYHSGKSDSIPSDDDVFGDGYDTSVRKQTFIQSETGTSVSFSSALSLEARVEDESGVRSTLGSEPAPSVDYTSLGDLVEGAVISVSRGNCNSVKNRAEDVRIALRQQAESDYNDESEPSSCQRDQSLIAAVCERPPEQQSSSSEIPAVYSSITATNTINHSNYDTEDTVLTPKDFLGFTDGGAGDSERPSLEKQNDDILTIDGEQISTALCQRDQSLIAAACERPPQQQSSSSELPAIYSSITATNTILRSNNDIEDSALTPKDSLGSAHGGASDAERLFQERENNDLPSIDAVSVCQGDQSLSSPVCEGPQQQSSYSEISSVNRDITTSTINQTYYDIEDSALTPKDLLGFTCGLTSDAERLSQNRQNNDIPTVNAEQIPVSLCQRDRSLSAGVCEGPRQQSSSSELCAVYSSITATNTINHSNNDIEDSALTPKDLLGAAHEGAGDPEGLPQERENNDILTVDAEQIPVSLCQRERSLSAAVCEKPPQHQSSYSEISSVNRDITTSTINQTYYDIEDSALTPKDLFGSAHGGGGDAERLSPEKQNDDIFNIDAEQISVPLCQRGAPVCERPPQEQSSSSEIPAVTNTVYHSSNDVEDLAVTPKDLLEPVLGVTGDAERLFPERQNNSIFAIDTEQISASRTDTDDPDSDRNVSCLNPSFPLSDNFGQPGSRIGEEMRSDPIEEDQRLEVCVSVDTHTVTDFLSESSIIPVVSSSGPLVFSNPGKTYADDQGEDITHSDKSSGLERAQAQDSQDALSIDKNNAQSLHKNSFHESSTSQGFTDSSHPDHLMNLLKQNSLSLDSEDMRKAKLISQDERGSQETEQSDAPNIQLQLLQVFKTVSTSQDLSVLKEVMDTLSSALGCESQQEQWHTLESIKEESSEGEDEESGEDDGAPETHQPSVEASASSYGCKVEEVKYKLFSIHDYLECVGRLQDHSDVLEDARKDLSTPIPTDNNMEELQNQIDECQSLQSQLSSLADVLTVDMEKAKQLINSADEDVPQQIHHDLASIYLELEPDFTAVSQMCAERSSSLIQAMETGKVYLESTYQQHLSDLNSLAGLIQNNSEMLGVDLNTCDVDTLKHLSQQNKDMEDHLQKEARLKLEDVTFDIQCFISEHTQFLSPAKSSYLLKFLSTTQRAFRDQIERLVTQKSALDVLLDARERENLAESLLEKQKEFTDKLADVCDNLTLTENRLIGHKQQAENAESITDLQQYQQEHQALQKDVLTNASALNDVISSTNTFLVENRSKMTPDQITAIESKLEEAKSKAKVINQRAEDSRKDLEKAVTTAIQQESEKAAAVEQLEESKSKIEGLLDWISNVGNKNKSSLDQTDHVSQENGNLPEEPSAKGLITDDDNANGNALQATEKDFGRETSGEDNESPNLDKQYQGLKAHHQEILSQQQDLIMATQSAQAMLDKQANVLSPQEKEALQKNIQELKERYETSLTQAEQQMKQVQCVQEELKKFQDDCEEFENWLNQAEEEILELGAPASSLNILSDNLQRQKSFSEDVISHKGDLRFITISGQKVLDVAKAFGSADPAATNPLLHVDTSGTCSAVKDKLDSAASRYKTLHSQCNLLGNNLKDVVDKYKKYDDSSTGLLKWLNSSEEEARKQQSEAIAADPQTLQKQLEDTKVLQGQMMGHQTAIDSLRKTAESLITSEGDLLSNPDEIQETVDDIVERYDNLSKSVSDRNEKLQITLTRSMSVQDGLDEMMGWMEGVEASVEEKGQITLDSASLGGILSKEAALEQDIASRQSSISAMKAKVKKFVETADPSAAALLQSKMDSLSQRFSDACDQHRQKIATLEKLKEKVEQFENVAEKVQQFVLKRSQDLHETDGPGKTFNELSQLMQNTKADMAEYAGDLEKLQTLSKELSEISPDGNKAQIQSKLDNLSNVFSTFKDTIKEKEEELSSCQDQLGEFRSAASALTKWLEEANDKVPADQPSSSEKTLESDLQIVTGLLDEWTSKGPIVQDLNTKGSTLCNLITFLTSPTKTKTPNKSALTNGDGPASHTYLTNKELMVIQQNMSSINVGYTDLGETLKNRSAQLSSLLQKVKEAQKETDDMMLWLKDMKKTAQSWNSAATEKDSVKTQLEQQKAFEDNMKQKQEALHKLREKLLDLIKTHPNSPEAAKWKQMLAEIDAAWADISGSVEERKQHLEQSNKNLDIFQTTEQQLGQWLSEKELMMSVLGPLSIDPNMLKMQKQQVQILQNEFKSRKPQYEQLEEAASAILSSSGDQDPSSGKLVNEQLAAVTQKWAGLTGQLDQRDSLIDQAVVKTGKFQELLRSLSNTATHLESQLTNHQGLSTQPDAVKKQLEDAQNISAQLREEKKKLKEAEAINEELTAMVTEDYLKADLARQLESVCKPFKQLEEKAAKRIEQLNSTFASSQQFHQTSRDLQSWLGEKLQDQSKPKPISAKVEVLQQTVEEHSKLQKALGEHEKAFNTIIGEGEMLLHNIDGAEKLALQGQLTTLSSNWEEVKKSSAEQADKLQTALMRSLKYQEHAEKLNSWIQECEASEGRVKLTVDPAAVETSISQLKALQKDVDKHRGLVEQLNAAADSLLEVANTDTDAIKEEKASTGKRVDNIVESLQSKRESSEKISHTVKEFNDACKEAKTQLEGAKKQVDAYETQGVQAHSNKSLTNMKAQHKSLEAVQNQVEHMKALAKDLVVDVPDAEGVTDLLLQADSIEKDYSNLNKKLEETCQALEGKLQGIGQFQNNIREMFAQFTELDDELDSMSPVDLNLDTLKEQQDSIQSFVTKLRELMANTANAGDSCKKMLESEPSPDLLGLKRDLHALSKQCGKLLDRAKGREVQVQSTLTKLEELYGKLNQMEDKLCRAVDKEASQEPVSMETEVINQQLEAFKAFQKEDIDPLQNQLQDINSLGQGLIQNAAKGTSTKKLEDDLEGVNSKWNTLNKKIAERSAQLHEALLHCGQFQDALESLLSWLTDTEELVANQKPPSAEFKVVKAQIQEQKLLQRLLDDRKPTVELIKKEGGKVAELAESVDKEKVAKEIECLGQRWDTLLKKAENRHKQLESILVVTQQFHETLEPLSEWLSATEKHLANSEPIGTETSKLEDQISQHKALEEEIMNHSKDLFQAVNLGQMLKTVSSVDDKEFVQSKLDTAQASYIELQERCRRKAEMLQQALANAQLFGEDEVALMNWLNEIHTRLSEVSVEDYRLEVLEKQLADQRALQNDIGLRKKNVDQAISNGVELLKQTTGDEVIVIQGKLDGIKTKYAEINSMSASVLKTLEQVLSLSSKLQHTHTDLSSWLEKAEAEINSFAHQEPVGEQLIHSQSRQKAMLKEIKDQKPVLDQLNELSSSLLDLIPWHTRESLDKLVSEDNERYRAAYDTLTQKVDQINADILKSQQFEQAADNELSWLTDAEGKLLSMGEIRLEQDQTTAQLQAQKIFSMDIMRHKDAVDEIVKTGKAIMTSKNPEEKEILKAKTQTLLEKYGVVSQLNSERCLQLERAQSLATQFWETYEELGPWLQETLNTFSQLPPPAIEYDTLRQQQEDLRQMRELIAEHKPHIDKMNKTGPQLLELSPVEGEPIREKYTATDQLYTKLKADVKQRAATLDEAISKSTQFHDKIDPMLESLERIAERLHQPPSISVEVDKIREQITENKTVSVDLEKLQPSYETLKQRGEEMIARSEGADKDLSAKAVQDKLDRMVFLWNDIQALVEEREAKLLDVMDLADKFWCDHTALIVTIKDSHDLLRELEEPGVDPSVVKQQQEFVEGFKEEIDGLQEELDGVRNQGAELMTACGEPDKPVIKKSLDEVNTAWENLNKTWKERGERLEEAMQAAVQFQDGLQGMFDWVDILESKLDSMSPVGTDLETVKQQIVELKEFKGEAYQLQIEMERLNHQAGLLLKKVTEEADRSAIQEPMSELKMLWDNLDEKIISRQHKLEGGLLALGQFQHALDELLAWMSHTEELLNEQKNAGGDPKAIEIELAKHNVLQIDVLAHKSTVETVNKAGNDLVQSSAGEEASSLQSKLENLNQRWKAILEKTEQRKQQLESSLLQAQGFHGEIEDMQQWLKDTERQLLASKAVGGLPDTAREQLNAHLELCSAFESKEELYQELQNKGQQLLTMMPEGPDSNTEQDLANLKEKWEAVQAKVAERKVKLEEALTVATDFHNSLQDFINWLTQAEQTLNTVSPASLILETIMFQIDEHKMFVTEVNSHREHIIELDKTGTHLKYFSQKQDVVLIKNLLLSVQGRWEKLVQRSVERGRLLDDARKRAKQFHENFNKLMEWLDESEKTLDSEVEIANDPDKIKTQLAQHKEFQKALGSKHSVYDTTTRTGRALKDKTTLQDDRQKLDDMLSELRDKWDTVCGKSVERQNKLEEALLFSGQFTDALQALIDWLYRVEPQLAEDQPVHGDIDLVLNLIDNHKVFQKELGKRTVSVQALKRSARELIENTHDDSSWVKVQMLELSTRWETVCNLSVSKQTRLEQALGQAEEFHSAVHILLEWLAEAEQSLRFHGSLPDDEEALRALIEQHKVFMKKLEEKRVALNKAASMGEAILSICHPDSITTIKHWNTIIKARFEEVQAWARQHQQRLATALTELLATQELLENLLTWLQWAETNLNDKDKEPLPQEIEEVKNLIAEHQAFMEEMTRKQPDVDKITKTHKRKAAAEPQIQSQIPVLDKGRAGRKRSPTQAMYASSTQAPIETKNPRVNLLVTKWQHVWLLALDRRRKLNDALDRLEELKEFANFDFDVWRKRYMRWMNHKKSRVMDFFRRIDKDQDGKVTRQEFIEGILSSKFPTSRLEMSAVADIFDRDGDGYIDYYEFVAALHPNKDAYKPLTDADKIEDEVTRQVAKCKCPKRFQVEQIGANKYRFYLGNQFGLVHCLHDSLIGDETIANRENQNLTPHLHVAVLESCILFGDSQQLRLVRILRSTVMVRVGGGWMALDEFLVKNDPCRVHHHGSKMLRSESNSSITQSPIAKGRTNVELREKFILPEGTTQVMASFRYRGRRSRPSSRGASPNRSTSSQSLPVPINPAATSTPKNPQHITRNYDKPWLTNSKPSTPLKSSDSFGSQGSSSESNAVQGSKLRLPGYLSGKGFQSGEEGSLISAAVLKARTQAIGESRKNSSRPGSKAGSRGSSRRGSDASDFDISDIQSVCSDVSETVGDSARATPRSASRQHGGKPSKIPTPQRRMTPTSKLAKGLKR
ncbi:dystonin isoform X2 [Astatotilapia calliptera]|uniref:dystonin isoform X2 n=1 Tax=Astatotilapia calliptera TaxID=8154 RepID=UPI000E40D3E9|nr:dystonin isoform X2 [Astatotilapia calliptera]